MIEQQALQTIFAFSLGLVVATVAVLVQRGLARIARLRQLEKIRKTHQARIKSFSGDPQAHREAEKLAAASNELLSALAEGARPTPLQRSQQLPYRTNTVVTGADLLALGNDIKAVFRAETTRSTYSGFLQNFAFTTIGILVGAWLQKYPLF